MAKNKANSIKSKFKREEFLDKVLSIEINKLIEENKLDDAKNKAQLINNQYDRTETLEKINSLK